MKLTKSMKNKLTAVLAAGVLMTSMVGCSSTSKEAELTDLTITHVTSPLNVPSIIQKANNVFAEEFKANGKDVTINYADITSGADQTQALASGDVDVLYAVGGTSVISAAANGADIKILNMYSRPSGRNRGLPLRRRRGQGPHLAKRWEPRGFSRVACSS